MLLSGRGMFWNVAVICPILGLTWLFGVFSQGSAHESAVFVFVFTIVNSLQVILDLCVYMNHTISLFRKLYLCLPYWGLMYICSAEELEMIGRMEFEGIE